MSQSSSSRSAALPLRRIARQWAVQYLYQVDLCDERPSEATLAYFWAQAEGLAEEKLAAREHDKCRETAQRFIQGVHDHLDELDVCIDKAASNWDVKRLAAIDRNIMRLAAYELRYEPEIPAAASINEALEICRVFGQGDESVAFINGILDHIRRVDAQEQESDGD